MCKEVVYGSFIWLMPIMGGLLLICYIWGRYYANKLDYARTIQILLDDSEEEGDEDYYDENATEIPDSSGSNSNTDERAAMIGSSANTNSMPTSHLLSSSDLNSNR